MSRKKKVQPELNYLAVELLFAEYYNMRHPHSRNFVRKAELKDYMMSYKQATITTKQCLLADLKHIINRMKIKNIKKGS